MYEWFISLRYLRAKHKQRFISLISFISVAGITVGVLALIVVMSVYAGFTTSLRDQILGVNAHIIAQQYGGQIYGYNDEVRDKILATKGVEGATPYIYAQSLLSSANGNGSGVVLRGIDPKTAKGVLGLPEQLIAGNIDDLDRDGRVPTIILGKSLAKTLGATVGDKIRLISPSGPLTPMGVIPKITTTEVSGIFETGMFQYDDNLAYISIANAQAFLGVGDIAHGIEIVVNPDELDQADIVAMDLRKTLGASFLVRDWMEMNKNLFAAFKLEKIGMFICMALIIMVAALNIISALVMVVMEKTKDIAILKSMGANSASIMRIFLYQGLVIGITGTILGVLGGLGLCELLSRYKFIELPANVYPMSTLPIKVLPMDVTIIAVSSLVITLLATIYPSWKASKVEPAEVLG